MEQGKTLEDDIVMALVPVIDKAMDGTPKDLPMQERAAMALSVMPDRVVEAVRDTFQAVVMLAEKRLTEGAPGE